MSTVYAWKVIVLAVSRELCVFYVDDKWMSTRGRGSVSYRRMWIGGQKADFFLHIING